MTLNFNKFMLMNMNNIKLKDNCKNKIDELRNIWKDIIRLWYFYDNKNKKIVKTN